MFSDSWFKIARVDSDGRKKDVALVRGFFRTVDVVRGLYDDDQVEGLSYLYSLEKQDTETTNN